MVVADNGLGLDTRSYEVVYKSGLDLGLSTLEVVSGDEDVAALSQLQQPLYQSVLRRPIDVGAPL